VRWRAAVLFSCCLVTAGEARKPARFRIDERSSCRPAPACVWIIGDEDRWDDCAR
jgi:hypothetical protein